VVVAAPVSAFVAGATGTARAYRGSHNLRAVRALLGHSSIATRARYTAVDDDEIRAAAACAW